MGRIYFTLRLSWYRRRERDWLHINTEWHLYTRKPFLIVIYYNKIQDVLISEVTDSSGK